VSNPRRANGSKRDKVRARVLREESTCHLCGQWVDVRLPHGLPGSPEVDELTPVTYGGSPFNRTNCRLAHRYCNRLRWHRPVEPARAELMADATLQRRRPTRHDDAHADDKPRLVRLTQGGIPSKSSEKPTHDIGPSERAARFSTGARMLSGHKSGPGGATNTVTLGLTARRSGYGKSYLRGVPGAGFSRSKWSTVQSVQVEEPPSSAMCRVRRPYWLGCRNEEVPIVTPVLSVQGYRCREAWNPISLPQGLPLRRVLCRVGC